MGKTFRQASDSASRRWSDGHCDGCRDLAALVQSELGDDYVVVYPYQKRLQQCLVGDIGARGMGGSPGLPLSRAVCVESS